MKENTTASRGFMSGDPLTLAPVGFAPTITAFSIPTHVTPLTMVTLSATALNVLPDLPVAGEFLAYSWDLDGDGTFDASGTSVDTSFDGGVHDVLLRVSNNYGFYSDRLVEVTSEATNTTTIPHEVPEPGSFLLVGLGLLVVVAAPNRARAR